MQLKLTFWVFSDMSLMHYFTVKNENYSEKSKVSVFSFSFLEGVFLGGRGKCNKNPSTISFT